MIERSVGVPFYRMGEGAGHGRGRNGDGKHGRRPWKVAGVGASVPGDWGAIQGGIKGERERRERGLIPPNQFWNSRFESRGFWGGLALGFRGERESRAGGGRRPHVLRACGERLGVGQVAGWRGLGLAGRREGRCGPEGGGEEGVGREGKRRPKRKRGRREGLRPRAERERGETLGQTWPKENERVIFRFFFLINSDNCFCCLIIISGALKI
jgi:hypothetical protein